MRYQWDDGKNITNFLKHRVWFEEARSVWEDQQALEMYDPKHSLFEDRFIRIGHSKSSHLLAVVFCERFEGSLIRIISARKVTARERSTYEEGI